jgi:predicted house-cleaning NTP pyrophosphatase (Maf/HAM1 superfamily)
MDNLSPTHQPHLRQSYTAAQKIRIVQESMRPGLIFGADGMMAYESSVSIKPAMPPLSR